MTNRPKVRERLSARIEPFWLNPATVKGAIAILAGGFILAAPDASTFLLRMVVGVSLVVSGASAVWFGVRIKAAAANRSVLEGLVSVVAGAAILVYPSTTIRVLAILAAGYLAVRGLGILTTSINQRRQTQPWGVDLVRALLYVSVAVVVVVLPQSIIVGLLAAMAAAAVIAGAIMLVYGIRERSSEELVDVDVASVTELVNDWLLDRDIGPERREGIGHDLFFEEPDRGSKLASWWVMLLLSVAIATFGIIQDSTAVVIGAMLIAPLMTPILGISAGIVNSWGARMAASGGLVVAGALAAIGLALVVGQWVPIIVPLAENSQVTSRVSPNLVDMLIALAAGAAGAYANVDDRVSDSIAGVAIAVALVPPLGVVGLTLQAGMFEESWGSLLLFMTNLVSIVLAAAVVFFLTGYAPYRRLQEDRARVVGMLRTVLLAAIVIMIPLALTAEDILSKSARLRITNDATDQWLAGSTLRLVKTEVSGSDVGLFLTGPDEVPPLEDLESVLTDEFGTPVSLTVEHAPTQVLTYDG